MNSSPSITVYKYHFHNPSPFLTSLIKPSVSSSSKLTMTPFTAFIVFAFTLALSFPLPSDGRIIPAEDRMHADLPVEDRSGQRFTISTGEIPLSGPLSGDRFMHLRIHRPMNHHGYGHGPLVMRSRRGCRHGISTIRSDGKPIMMPFVLRHSEGVRARPLPEMDIKNWKPEPEREQEQEPEGEQGMVKWFRDVIRRY